MPTNALTATNIATTQPRQDAKPGFGWGYKASSLAAGAAGLGTPILAQTRNTFIAIPLTSLGAGLGSPTCGTVGAFFSITNYGVTSPILDTASPNITITSAFNFTATSLATGAARFINPVLAQLQSGLIALPIATASAGFNQPQFVQFQALTAVNLATSAAGIGTPGVGSLSAVLTSQLNFISVDNNIHLLNAAIFGIQPQPVSSLNAMASLANSVNSSIIAISNFVSKLSIAVANKAALAASSTLLVSAQQMLPGNVSLAIGASLQPSAAGFIFDIEKLTSVAALNAAASQYLTISPSVIVTSTLTVGTPVVQKSILAGLVNSTALFANPFVPVLQAWAGSASLSVASSLTVNLQQYDYATALYPTSTLQALTTMRLAIQATLSSAVLALVNETLVKSSTATLTPSLAVTASGSLWENSNILLSSNTTCSGLLSQSRTIATGLIAQIITSPPANLQGSFAVPLSPSTLIRVAEGQQLAVLTGLTPAASFSINSQTLILPSARWLSQTALLISERILPGGTAFYFATPHLTISETQMLSAKSPVALQTLLVSHEGLMMLQAPVVSNAASTMTVKEQLVIGPNLRLISNIVLNTNTLIALVATQTALVSQTNFNIQYTLNQGMAAAIHSDSTMPVSSHMAMAGLSNLSPACYINPNMSMQRTIEISSMITAQQSRNRIVAKGNLVRKRE
jgi:hypothetical protein